MAVEVKLTVKSCASCPFSYDRLKDACRPLSEIHKQDYICTKMPYPNQAQIPNPYKDVPNWCPFPKIKS